MKLAPKYGQTLPARLAAVAVAIFLTGAGPAAAQAPVVDGYGGAGGAVTEVTGGGSAGAGGAGDVVSDSGASAAAGSANVTPVSGGLSGSAGVPTVSGNDLPFTGLDLALICAGGLLLLGIGFAARWLSGPRASQT
jgi:hypothetical protein